MKITKNYDGSYTVTMSLRQLIGIVAWDAVQFLMIAALAFTILR